MARPLKAIVLSAVTRTPRSVDHIAGRVARRHPGVDPCRNYVSEVLSAAAGEGVLERQRLAPPATGGQPPYGYYKVPRSRREA